MCGRFVRISPVEKITRHFGVTLVLVSKTPADYNVTPQKEVLVVNVDGERQLTSCRIASLMGKGPGHRAKND